MSTKKFAVPPRKLIKIKMTMTTSPNHLWRLRPLGKAELGRLQ